MSPEEINIVSNRIYEFINKANHLEFSCDYLKEIHHFLFQDILPNAGAFRKDNLFRKEHIIDDETIFYVNFQNIESYLKYDLDTEKTYNYQDKSPEEILKHFAKFTSNIWQVHPFNDGNTRTVATFMIIYFRALGYQPNNDILKNNFSYFRNALVLSNCIDKHQLAPYYYLIKFYENLLLNKDNDLDIKEMLDFNENERRKR